MNQEIIEFLNSKRTGVVAVLMLDGTVHAATVHFAYTPDPFMFLFLTSPNYRKLEPLRAGPTQASFVVGTEEGESQRTLQLDGTAVLADNASIRDSYFKKFPEKNGKHPEDVFFTFMPSWWRFTKWEPTGKTIITSDGKTVIVPKS